MAERLSTPSMGTTCERRLYLGRNGLILIGPAMPYYHRYMEQLTPAGLDIHGVFSHFEGVNVQGDDPDIDAVAVHGGDGSLLCVPEQVQGVLPGRPVVYLPMDSGYYNDQVLHEYGFAGVTRGNPTEQIIAAVGLLSELVVPDKPRKTSYNGSHAKNYTILSISADSGPGIDAAVAAIDLPAARPEREDSHQSAWHQRYSGWRSRRSQTIHQRDEAVSRA